MSMGDNTPSGPLLFLSHAGADTGAARVLKQRIEGAPEARKHGLKVWFDKDNLRAGEPWQKQLEDTIAQQATAFAVYVGSTRSHRLGRGRGTTWTITYALDTTSQGKSVLWMQGFNVTGRIVLALFTCVRANVIFANAVE
jgi:hypothetical protein